MERAEIFGPAKGWGIFCCFVTREWENTTHLGLGRRDGFPLIDAQHLPRARERLYPYRLAGLIVDQQRHPISREYKPNNHFLTSSSLCNGLDHPHGLVLRLILPVTYTSSELGCGGGHRLRPAEDRHEWTWLEWVSICAIDDTSGPSQSLNRQLYKTSSYHGFRG